MTLLSIGHAHYWRTREEPAPIEEPTGSHGAATSRLRRRLYHGSGTFITIGVLVGEPHVDTGGRFEATGRVGGIPIGTATGGQLAATVRLAGHTKIHAAQQHRAAGVVMVSPLWGAGRFEAQHHTTIRRLRLVADDPDLWIALDLPELS